METKTCTGCETEKPLTDFSKKSRNKDGLQHRCKPCNRAEQKAERERRGDERREKVRAYRERNKGRINAQKRRYYHNDIEGHREQKRRDYLKHRDARREANREYYYQNRDEILEKQAAAYSINERRQAEARRRAAEWAKANPERRRKIVKRSLAKPENKARVLAATRKRQMAKLQRTPPCADMSAINEFYVEAKRLEELTGIKFHVDHIVPLQGELVSGLHVAANLQLLPAHENLSKSNSFDVAA